jgi:CHAT domain-containing protein
MESVTEDLPIACPEAEQLAEYVDGRLHGAARTRVELHLADCERCRDVVAGAVQLEAEEPAVVPFRPRRKVIAIGSGVLALAAALILVVRVQPQLNPFGGPTPYEELVAAVGTNRTIEGRLTGGFKHGPLRSVTRSGSPSTGDQYKLLAAVARAQDDAQRDPKPEKLHALGLAYLLVDEYDKSITALEDAVGQREDPRILSDLSAAYLQRGRLTGRPEDYPKSLAAAERAIHIAPDLVEPYFNRALALEALNLHDSATRAWQEYLSRDPSSEWAAEVRNRPRKLSLAERQQAWDAERAKLHAAVSADDVRTVTAITEDAVQTVREFTEETVLAEWADAVVAADPRRSVLLKQARRLAEAVVAAGGDRLTLSGVEQFERAAADEAGSRRLAAAYAAYARGRTMQRAERPGDAGAMFNEARRALRAFGSPFYLRAATEADYAAYYAGRGGAIAGDLEMILAAAQAAGYPSVVGRAAAIRGVQHFAAGEFARAFTSHRQSQVAYAAANELEYLATAHQAAAEPLRAMGQLRESWEEYAEALAGWHRFREARRRQSLFSSLALAGLRQHLPEFVLWCTAESLPSAETARLMVGLAEQYVNRARAYALLRRGDDAQASLEQASHWIERVSDQSLATRLDAEIEAARGEIAGALEPNQAVAALSAAIGKYRDFNSAFRLARLYLARGRAYGKLAQDDLALKDYLAGVNVIQSQQAQIQIPSLRVSHFDEVWDLYDEALRLLTHRGDENAAFDLAKQSRGRLVAERRAGAVAQSQAERCVILHYVALSDRLMVWIERAHSRRLVTIPGKRAELVRHVHTLEDAAGARDTPGYRHAAEELGRILLTPAAADLAAVDCLHVVPDDVLNAIPFGALIDPVTHDYIVERFTVFVSSIGGAGHTPTTITRSSKLLALSAASPDPALRLRALNAADIEAAIAGREYLHSRIFTGPQATRATFVREVAGAQIVHFAGHAVLNADYPWLSRLIFNPDAAGDALFARDLLDSKFSDLQLVVLAACRAGAGPVARGEGSLSLARPFLMAGAHWVITSVWDVDDRAAAEFFEQFYSALAHGALPADALRSAQLAMIHSPDPNLSTPAAWAGVIAFSL